MSVYTRIPEELHDTAYGIFAVKGVIHPRKPHSNLHKMERKYSTLGNSVLSTENGGDFADDISSMNRNQAPKRLKIPSQFLKVDGGVKETSCPKIVRKNEGATQNGLTTDREMKDTVKKDGKNEDLNESTEGNPRMKVSGNDHSRDSESAKFRNRPTSKLIQDNQDLQKLFDSVRGKESQEQQSKKVGKLKVPLTFNSGINKEVGMDKENGFRKVDKKVRNASEMKDAGGLTLNECWNDRNMEKGRDETVYFTNNDLHDQYKADFQQSCSMPAKHKNAWENDAMELHTSHAKTKNSVQSYWLSKQKQAQKADVEAGDKDNMSGKNKMFMDDLNLATSTYGEMYARSGEQLPNTKFNKRYSHKSGQVVNSSDMDERGDDESPPANYMATEEDEKSPKVSLGNGKRSTTVGKLKLPSAFASNQVVQSSNAVKDKRDTANFSEQPNRSDKWKPKVSNPHQEKLEESQRDTKNFIDCKNDSSSIKESLDSEIAIFRDQIGYTTSNQEKHPKEVEEQENVKSHKENKPIGRLNIKTFFPHEKNEIIQSRKEEDSVVAKSRAIFDQTIKKKSDTKQKGVGRLRLESSKCERYEEIENLSPEGQVPSNMSNQMKEQLEKILQGRSDSVSSQISLSSSSSKRNDNKEVGSLSLSSISSLEASLTSFRTNEDFSARSYDEDPFIAGSDYEDGGNSYKVEVNSGTLESQLGNIFQKKNTREGSSTSSTASSLNTSLNAGGNVQVNRYNSNRKDDTEVRGKRKLLIDEIKQKYNDDGDTKGEMKSDSYSGEEKRNDIDEGEKAKNKYEYEYYESSKEKKDDNIQKIKGRISIPNIFECKREDEKKARVPKNKWKGDAATQNKAKEDVLADKKDDGKVETDIQMAFENKVSNTETEITSNQSKIVDSPSNFLGEQRYACDKPANGPGFNNNIDKGKDASPKGNGDHVSKKVNFHAGVGIIREDGSLDSAPTKQATAGKLSLSLLQSFDGGNATRNRPGTPGRVYNGRPKGAFDIFQKEERQVSPIAEEKTVCDGGGVAEKRDIPKSDEAEKVSSQEQSAQDVPVQATPIKNVDGYAMTSTQAEVRESPRKVIGKLSIPAMFK